MLFRSKGLTSGYVPLGAFFVSDRLYERLIGPEGKGKYFTNGFTYSAHPVACAAGLKNLEIIERENILDHVRRTGPYFMERLKTLLDLPIVGDVRGSHMMVCVETVADKKTKQAMPAEWDVAYRIIRHAMPRGLMVRPLSHQVILSPPLTIGKAEIDQIVEILGASIRAVADDLMREGLWREAA